MPELPEVEITARGWRRRSRAPRSSRRCAPGMVALKTVDPPLSALEGTRIDGVRRIGKMPVVGVRAAVTNRWSSCVHLMSAGRLQVFDKRASLKDRRSRVLIRLADGRELRLREFGTRQRAWAKLLRPGGVEADEMVATLGPGGVAGAAARAPRGGDRPAPPPASAAPRPARDRRDRALLGRRDPLGGGAVARFARARIWTTRTSSACTPHSPCSATRSSTTSR